MEPPGYQEGGEGRWWWEVARYLDSAQIALINAMAHNLDDQTAVFALQDKLCEGQRLLFEIFRAKDLMPKMSGRGARWPQPGVEVRYAEMAADLRAACEEARGARADFLEVIKERDETREGLAELLPIKEQPCE